MAHLCLVQVEISRPSFDTLQFDFTAMKLLQTPRGLLVTAAATPAEIERGTHFVSRFFDPKLADPEDPVTGVCVACCRCIVVDIVSDAPPFPRTFNPRKRTLRFGAVLVAASGAARCSRLADWLPGVRARWFCLCQPFI